MSVIIVQKMLFSHEVIYSFFFSKKNCFSLGLVVNFEFTGFQ